MITPKFTITQDDEFVYVKIKVPHIRVSSAELITEDCDFSFYCKPYLLKLHFPFPFKEEDEECKATYDPFDENGTMVAHLPKLTTGQHFPDLDLTTSLLTRNSGRKSSDVPTGTGIEVIHSENGDDTDLSMFDMTEELDAPPQLPAGLLASQNVTYGFNNMYSKVFEHLREELLDMTEIKHPDSIVARYRTMLRISAENQQFDAERYLGDNVDGENDPIYQEAMTFKTFHVLQWDAWKSDKAKGAVSSAVDGSDSHKEVKDPRLGAFEAVGGFTEVEQEALASKLPRREYLIPSGSKEEFALLLGLVDVLFAYCYDHRLTQGEGNVESAHTVARLSCTFSWLEDYAYLVDRVGEVTAGDKATDADATDQVRRAREECIRQTILFSLRRSVIFPYLRVWKLARKVLADVARILFLGKRAILKCLLQLYLTFEHTDTHYLLNKIFIADYCVWLQSAGLSEETLQGFAKLYNSAKGSIEKTPEQGKELVGFNLPALEAWAVEAAAESTDDEEEEEDSSDDDDSEDSDDSSTDSGGSTSSSSSGESNRGSTASEAEDSAPCHPSDRIPTAEEDVGLNGVTPAARNVPTANHATQLKSQDGTIARANDASDADAQAVAEDEQMIPSEAGVPIELLDFTALQREDPRLAYLWQPFAEMETSAASGASPVADDAAAAERERADALSKLLLLPKRKADVPAASEPAVNKPKRVLIEDITPQVQPQESSDTEHTGATSMPESDSVVNRLMNMSLLSEEDRR